MVELDGIGVGEEVVVRIRRGRFRRVRRCMVVMGGELKGEDIYKKVKEIMRELRTSHERGTYFLNAHQSYVRMIVI